MEKAVTVMSQVMNDPSLIFLFLICLELAWNACHFVLICISSRYYFEIIKEVRQTPSIRLTDFSDNTAAAEYVQEFQEEMLNEYPGYGHRENVFWYGTNAIACLVMIILDTIATCCVLFKSYWSTLFWMVFYFLFSKLQVATVCYVLKKCTNRIYLKRKWGHCAITLFGCIVFRLYMLWLSLDLPFMWSK